MEELKTERLILKRAHASQHAEEINKAMRDTVDSLQPWIPWVTGQLSIEETRIGLERFAGSSSQQYTFRLYLQDDTKHLIGMCGLMYSTPGNDEIIKTFEIGFWLHHNYTRKGFMSEAVSKIMIFGINVLHAQKFVLECNEKNIPSNKIAKKFGFNLAKKECTLLSKRPDWGKHILMHYEKIVKET